MLSGGREVRAEGIEKAKALRQERAQLFQEASARCWGSETRCSEQGTRLERKEEGGEHMEQGSEGRSDCGFYSDRRVSREEV